jgi:prophage tail gpP-like protein
LAMRRRALTLRNTSSVSVVFMRCVWPVLALASRVLGQKGHPRQRRITDMTDTRQTTLATAANTTGEEQAANVTAVVDHRRQVRHRDPVVVVRPIERSRKMITQEIAHRDFAAVENLLTSLANGGRESSLWLAARDARAALARAQEDAAIEAEDVLVQADEALVLG